MNYTVKPLQKQSEATEWEHAISAWKIKAKLHFVTTVIYFFSSQKSVSPYGFSADGPSVFQKWLGCNKLPNERFWAQLFPTETPFASCLAVTYAGICTHQSCFVSHPSLDGGGRNPSDRLILDCFHSLSWHPVSEVIYTVAWWQLVYNAM